MAIKVTLEMSAQGFKQLAHYLERHESDIAWEMNDFEDLRETYIAVFEDEPKKD